MNRLIPSLFFVGMIFPLTVLSLTTSEEIMYGRQIHNEILRASKLNSDYLIAFYIEDLKRSLERNVQLNLPIKITVIESSTVDAFAIIGGYIYLTTSLISLCENEDELSGVIAHELAHVAKRHVVKRLEREKVLNIGRIATLIAAMLSGDPKVKEAIIFSGMGAVQTASLFYTREDEREADILAQSILEKTNISCRGISDFLKRLRMAGKEADLPQYLLTHPYHEERIALLSSICREEPSKDKSVNLFEYVSERARILAHRNKIELLNYYEKSYDRLRDQRSLMGLTFLNALLGRKDDAKRALSEIREPMRNFIEAEVLFLAKDYKKSITLLKNCNFSFSKFILGRSYEELGDLEKAKIYYEEIEGYAEVFPEIYYRLSMIYGRMNREAKGFEYLGKFHLANGRELEAKSFFNRAISLYGKDSKEAEEIRKIIRGLERS